MAVEPLDKKTRDEATARVYKTTWVANKPAGAYG